MAWVVVQWLVDLSTNKSRHRYRHLKRKYLIPNYYFIYVKRYALSVK